ncbi:MAG: YczE/YyaS/YitT family protein, partial [Gaiellaceae bacterium]
TVSNVVFIGGTMDVVLSHLSSPHGLTLRIVCLVTGVFLNGVATGAYIGAGLGPGPRDGLMTGLAKRGHSIRVVRTSIEVSVVVIGWLLGGTVGVGTVLYAVSIGPLAHFFVPLFARTPIPEPVLEAH